MDRLVYRDFSDEYLHRVASSYAPLGCFLLICRIFGLEATASKAYRWLRGYRIEYGECLREAIASLHSREIMVLTLRYGLAGQEFQTLQQIACREDFKLTRQRISQIETRALSRLRHPSRSRRLRSLIEFLED